jgi:hypothetical protein
VPVSVTCPNGTTQTAATTDLANAACPVPVILSVSPANISTAVLVDAFVGIEVVTDSVLDGTSISAANVTLKAGTTAVAGVVSAVGTKSLKFVPTSKLNYAQAYAFSAIVKDTLGKLLTVNSIFTTAAISCLPTQRPSIDGNSCLSRPVCNLPNILSDTWTCLPPPGLVDSGQTQCDDGGNVLATCTSANVGDTSALPRQDGRFGKDVAASMGKLSKIGGGAVGFDYSKISNSGHDLGAGVGQALGSNPSEWACTRDNLTGLTWEVKVNNPNDLRHKDWIYNWYNSDGNTNGGNPGTASTTVSPQYSPWCKTDGRCDTEKFVADVNATALCTYTDWRMPTGRELLTIVHAGKYMPAIEEDYFPNTPAQFYHSGTTFSSSESFMAVDFSDGGSYGGSKTNVVNLRLVRGPSY